MYLNIGDMAFRGKIPIDDKRFSKLCDQYRYHDRKGKKGKKTYIQLASYSFGPIM